MTKIRSETIPVGSCEVHCLLAGRPDALPVVFLHGMKFTAATWRELGTLAIVAEAGFRAIAVDMPGFGLSPACAAGQDETLAGFLKHLGPDRAVLVGPSMGGRIALEFTLDHPEYVQGLVLVGAVGVEENKGRLSAISVPTLLIWGGEDQVSPLANCETLAAGISGSGKIIIEGAPHPCYVDNPEAFHSELRKFLDSVAG